MLDSVNNWLSREDEPISLGLDVNELFATSLFGKFMLRRQRHELLVSQRSRLQHHMISSPSFSTNEVHFAVYKRIRIQTKALSRTSSGMYAEASSSTCSSSYTRWKEASDPLQAGTRRTFVLILDTALNK